jgi:hypothetical protein
VGLVLLVHLAHQADLQVPEEPHTLAAIQDNRLDQRSLEQQARRVYQEVLVVQEVLVDREDKDTQVDLDIQGNQAVQGTQGNPVKQGCLEAPVHPDSQDTQGSQDNRANLGNQDNQGIRDIQANLVSHNNQVDQDIQVRSKIAVKRITTTKYLLRNTLMK